MPSGRSRCAWCSSPPASRDALGAEAAKAELRDGAGSQFDPAVVEALLQVIDGDRGGVCDLAEGAMTGSAVSEVLERTASAPDPDRAPLTGSGSAAALGEVRAACRRCGSHVSAVISKAPLSGNCGNCGSCELELLEL